MINVELECLEGLDSYEVNLEKYLNKQEARAGPLGRKRSVKERQAALNLGETLTRARSRGQILGTKDSSLNNNGIIMKPGGKTGLEEFKEKALANYSSRRTLRSESTARRQDQTMSTRLGIPSTRRALMHGPTV